MQQTEHLKKRGFEAFLESLWCVALMLITISVICFGANSGVNYYYYFTFFLFIGVSVFILFARRGQWRNIALPLQTVWYGLFILLALVSAFWASSRTYTFAPMSRMVQILAVTYCIATYVDNEKRLERALFALTMATMFMIAYIFVRTPSRKWFTGFLGSVTLNNTNDIGFILAICVLIGFYEVFVKHKRWYLLPMVLSFFTAILTSSRKALLMCVTGVLMIVTFNYRARNYMLRVLCIILVLALAILMIYQVPSLYKTIGVRMDRMFNYVMNDRSADNSLSLRRFYIDMAKSFFWESPFFGIGFNNFTFRIRDYERGFSYAHNNYMEIAADLGITGLIAYYWFYLYVFLKLCKHVLNGHKTGLLFLPVMVLFLVFEYGMVNYYKMQVHMLIALAYAVVRIDDRLDDDLRLREENGS